jgi:hypothetical protein
MTPPDEAPATAGWTRRHLLVGLGLAALIGVAFSNAPRARQVALDHRCEMQAFAELWNRFGRP